MDKYIKSIVGSWNKNEHLGTTYNRYSLWLIFLIKLSELLRLFPSFENCWGLGANKIPRFSQNTLYHAHPIFCCWICWSSCNPHFQPDIFVNPNKFVFWVPQSSPPPTKQHTILESPSKIPQNVFLSKKIHMKNYIPK